MLQLDIIKKTKKSYEKELVKIIKIFLEKKKKNSDSRERYKNFSEHEN